MGIRSWLRVWVRTLSQPRFGRLWGIALWKQTKDNRTNTRRTRRAWNTVIRKQGEFLHTISGFGHCNTKRLSHSFTSGNSLVAEGKNDIREYSASDRNGTTPARCDEEYVHAERIKKRKGPREL